MLPSFKFFVNKINLKILYSIQNMILLESVGNNFLMVVKISDFQTMTEKLSRLGEGRIISRLLARLLSEDC